MRNGLALIAIMVFGLIVSFGIVSALVYGVCWAFGFTFSVKIALGVWFIIALLRAVFISKES